MLKLFFVILSSHSWKCVFLSSHGSSLLDFFVNIRACSWSSFKTKRIFLAVSVGNGATTSASQHFNQRNFSIKLSPVHTKWLVSSNTLVCSIHQNSFDNLIMLTSLTLLPLRVTINNVALSRTSDQASCRLNWQTVRE